MYVFHRGENISGPITYEKILMLIIKGNENYNKIKFHIHQIRKN